MTGLGQGAPAPGAMPADSCGTILAIALFPKWQRAAGVQLNRVTLLVEFAAGFNADEPPVEKPYYPRGTDAHL